MEIRTLDGKLYIVTAQPGTGCAINPYDIEQIKYDIMNGNLRALNPATCHDVVQGTPQSITITATGGVAPYTYTLYIDGVVKASAGPISGTSNTFNVTFTEALGSHTLRGQITDSCSTPQTSSDQCTTFNILAPAVWTSTTISGCASAINIGANCQLTAACRDQYSAAIACGALTWQSSNTAIATVNSSGLVTAVAAGSAGITARNSTGTIVSNSISVTVNAPVCPTISCSITACPPSSIVQGTATSTTVLWSGGTPNYSLQLLRDGVAYGSAVTGIVGAGSLTFNFTVDSSWSIGSHTVAVRITDACSTPQTCTTATCNINVTAPVTTGTIACSTTPTGASIALDGVNQGVTTPINLTNVSAGSHTVTFTLAGYNACPVTVTVVATQTVNASCTMTVACSPITSASITVCPASTISQGTNGSLQVSWAGGNGSYIVQLLRDGANYLNPINVGSTSIGMNFPVDGTWTLTTHTVAVRITDTCPATPVTTGTCSVNVTAPCTALGASMNIV